MKIGFIGAGNMATAIITGLLKNSYANKSIYISDINKNVLTKLQQTLNINIINDNKQLAGICDIVVLAIKPNIAKQVCKEIAGSNIKLLVSVLAGIRITSIETWLNNGLSNNTAIVRLMPNTPAIIGYGATGIYANNLVSSSHKQQINNIVNSIGIGVWVDYEGLIDTITAISGSGPAYFFYMLEIMIESAVELGLDKKSAHKLATQTALGASLMAQNTIEYETLRDKVTSPNGTTYAAIEDMKNNNVAINIKSAIKSAYLRSKELADEFAK